VNNVPRTLTREDLVELLLGGLFQRAQRGSACVGEQHVDAASPLPHRVVEPVEVVEIGDVDHYRGRPIRSDGRRACVQFGPVATGDEHVRALAARRWAVASLIPVPPPVTTAVFPSKRPM
jgi:hypothetical protein